MVSAKKFPEMSLSHEIEAYLADRFGRGYCVLTGSGTTAIYLYLKQLPLGKDDTVLLPGTCCYAPAYAVKYSGLKVDFCDVSLKDACMTVEAVKEAVELNPSIKLVIGVHIYGNVCEARQLKNFCDSRGLYFIEDACQSYGAGSGDHLCCSIGKVAIMSFGYSKIVEVGDMGALLTDDQALADDIRKGQRILNDLEAVDLDLLAGNHTRKYWCLQKMVNQDHQAGSMFGFLYKDYERLFIKALNSSNYEALHQLLKEDKGIIARRRRLADEYRECLRNVPGIKVLLSENEPVPWRFAFLMNDVDVFALSEHLRGEGFDVGNWYPNLAERFVQDYSRNLPNARRIGHSVCNFWNDQTHDTPLIAKLCRRLDELLPSYAINI